MYASIWSFHWYNYFPHCYYCQSPWNFSHSDGPIDALRWAVSIFPQPSCMSNTIIIYSLQRRIATILQIRLMQAIHPLAKFRLARRSARQSPQQFWEAHRYTAKYVKKKQTSPLHNSIQSHAQQHTVTCIQSIIVTRYKLLKHIKRNTKRMRHQLSLHSNKRKLVVSLFSLFSFL